MKKRYINSNIIIIRNVPGAFQITYTRYGNSLRVQANYLVDATGAGQPIESGVHGIEQMDYLDRLALTAHVCEVNYVTEEYGHLRKLSC